MFVIHQHVAGKTVPKAAVGLVFAEAYSGTRPVDKKNGNNVNRRPPAYLYRHV
jgi:hypothetical protein